MSKILFALVLLGGVAIAQPTTDRSDAKALVGTGVKLLEAKDYLGALAIFKDAYARFPSAKILLNIGTTYKLLGRDAEAANAYQKYLDSTDADPKRIAEVRAALDDLDTRVGKATIAVPEGAEVQIGEEWLPPSQAKLLRFTPGQPVRVRARKPGFIDGEADISVTAGATTTVDIALKETPKTETPTTPTIATTTTAAIEQPSVEVTESSETQSARSRIGAIANVHVAVYPKLGSAWLVGATFDVLPALSIDAAVLLGPGLVSDGMASLPPPSIGGYIGANFAFSMRNLRPRVGAGLPVFASDGARFSLRGAVGAEYVASRHLSFALDLGAEVALNPQNDIRDLAVVPSLGVAGRL